MRFLITSKLLKKIKRAYLIKHFQIKTSLNFTCIYFHGRGPNIQSTWSWVAVRRPPGSSLVDWLKGAGVPGPLARPWGNRCGPPGPLDGPRSVALPPHWPPRQPAPTSPGRPATTRGAPQAAGTCRPRTSLWNIRGFVVKFVTGVRAWGRTWN